MSGGAPLKHSQMPLQKVHEVQFEVFKEKQIKDYAVCRIDHAKSFENGVAVKGGINDLRMGSTDFDSTCETCNMRHPDCPGHFGYVELAEPLFNIGVFDLVLLALKCVCKGCGALLLDNDDLLKRKKIMHLTGLNRLRMIAKLCKKECKSISLPNGGTGGCGIRQHNIGRFQGIYPGIQVKATLDEQDQVWHADMVYQIFDRVSNESAKEMGFTAEFCHPRDLLIRVLPVPPPQVRPAISFGSMKSDDELTHQIMTIVKQNILFRRHKESDNKADIDRSRALLQEHVATYFNNASTYYKPTKMSDTKKLKSLTERLKGKYGRLRGNLMGKRVDFSARTVITGDPNIDVDEVGVPFSVAMTLTFPERVNAINKKRLTEFVQRSTYPSANYIIEPNGSVIKLGFVRDRSKINLSIGSIVERHVINGDVVLFNRQPTLHRMSMMGHRVRVLNYNTFRLNLSCTTPYNADFDGDEMNLHVPQSLLTKAELMEMMMVPKNFVSPNKSAPCMGIVQDSLLGSYRLTDKDTFLDKYFVQNVSLWLNIWELPIPAILKPKPLWTGKQIFSLALPEVNHPASPYSEPPFPEVDSSDDIMIHRGELLIGAITKKIIGAAAGSLIHVIFNERGSDEVARFINSVQRVTAFFLYNFAFSVGVQDTVADNDTLSQMNNVLLATRDTVKKIGASANSGTLERKAGMTLMQSFEADVNKALNKCREVAANKALQNVRRTNGFKVMILAGSKGTDLNICQIAVFVGQQNVAGARIPFGFRQRTLPHFVLDDYGEASRGMATRGYVVGLLPHEFYFHTMAGREGLIDTAVKTSDTGYLQRKLMKALEDVHAAYDGTVRTATQEVIQLIYGEDGLDGARIEGEQDFMLPLRDDKNMKQTYRFEYNEDGTFSNEIGGTYMDPRQKKMLIKDPGNVEILQREFDQLQSDRKWCRNMPEFSENTEIKKLRLNLPVNVGRLIQNARSTMGKRSHLSNLSPISVIEKVKALQDDLASFFASHHKGIDSKFTNALAKERVDLALTLFCVHLRQMLGSKRVLKEYKLNDKSFSYLLKEIRTKFHQSLISPGEMIGSIAAQSCGEPATQMTLNTFHNAGISSKNVTLGVPRLLELLNVSKNQRNSSMDITLIPEWEAREKAQKAQHFIEYCTLESLTTTVQIIYDPDLSHTVVEEDQQIIEWEEAVTNEEDHEMNAANTSPFIARIILDSDVFNDKLLNMKDVKSAIRAVSGHNYIIQANMENVGARILRLRPRTNAGDASVPKLLQEIPDLLAKVHLLGIKGIKKTLLKKNFVYRENEKTGEFNCVTSWMIDTEGTALKQVFVGVLDREDRNIIDFRSTISNKVPEVAQVLGIEAARRVLMKEMRAVYVSYNLNINYRHYAVLVDSMCQRGYLMAVSRTGINRSEMSGPLMRCSFEETVKILMGAAAFGEYDPVQGVSANIILGNQARIGTGMFDLMLNMSELQRAVPQEDAIAPGKDANVYHGGASVLPSRSEVDFTKSTDATPLVNLPSMAHKTMMSASNLDFYSMNAANASMVHDMKTEGLPYSSTANFSSSYSALSSASVYQPLNSSMAPASAQYPSEASSFHLQSSQAFMATPVDSSVRYSGTAFGNVGGGHIASDQHPDSAQYRGMVDSENVGQSASHHGSQSYQMGSNEFSVEEHEEN